MKVSRELGFLMSCGGGVQKVWTALAKARAPKVQCLVQVMGGQEAGVSGSETTGVGMAV